MLSNLAQSLSPILSSAVTNVQSKIQKTQTELATNVNPNLSGASIGVIVSLSTDISTWSTRTVQLKTANDLVGATQTGLSSISTILSQMLGLVNSAVSDPTNTSSYTASYNSLAEHIRAIATSAQINGSTLLGPSPGITIYPALSSSISSNVAGVNFASIATSLTNSDISASSTDTIATLNGYIAQVSAMQSSMNAYSSAISSDISAANGFSSGLSAHISSLQNIDTASLQANLQSLNNQQSIDYYLITQMNSASAAQLTIFH